MTKTSINLSSSLTDYYSISTTRFGKICRDEKQWDRMCRGVPRDKVVTFIRLRFVEDTTTQRVSGFRKSINE